MAETLLYTVALRDQLTPSLKQVNKALDQTTAATGMAASASAGKNFEYDKAEKKATGLEKALKQGERTVSAFNTQSGKTVSTMTRMGSASGSAAQKIAQQETATAKASSGWGKLASAVQGTVSKVNSGLSSAGSRFNGFASNVRGAASKAATGFGTGLAPISGKAREAFGKVDGAARAGLNKAKGTLSKFTDQAKREGKEGGSGFANAFKGAVGALGVGLTIGGAFTLGKDMVVEAGNAEQAMGAIDAVFKGGSKSVRDFAKTADQSVGLSINQFGELATVLGAQLKNGGTSMDVLGSKTTDLVKAGADMSAMFGGTAAEAVESISSALRGERDPIEKYGVSLTQAAVDAKAAEMGFKKVGKTFGTEANQAATIALIMEQTADAHGRFADESGTVMNEQQKLTAGWANMKTEIGDRLIPYVSSLFSWLSGVLPGALDTVLGALDGTIAGLKAFGGWVQDNVSWLRPLSMVLLGAAVAYGVYRGVLVAGTVATAIATAAQNAWNASLLASPITWIVLAIGALVGALVWFFTQTETGKAVWENVWNAMKTAVGAVVGWFQNTVVPILQGVWNAIVTGATWMWENVLKPTWEAIQIAVGAVINWFQTTAVPIMQAVWSGIVAGAQWMWNNVLKPIWDAMQIGFLIVATLIGAAWEFVLKPVWNAISTAAMWLWNNGIKPAFDGIQWGWNLLVTGIKAYWEFVLKPVWDAIVAAAKWMWFNAVKPVFDAFKFGWDALLLGIKIIWETVLKPVWNAVVSAARWMWFNAIKPVFDAFKLGWDALGNAIKWVKDTLISPVFNAVKNAGQTMWNGLKVIFDSMKSGIRAVGDGFNLAKDVIAKAWTGIKDAAKGPAEFVVNTVYNKGILPIWNRAAGIFGMDDKKLKEVKMATGGRVRGPGSGTSDSIPARLSNGEFVVNANATRKHLPLLHAINGPQGVGASEFRRRSSRTGRLRTVDGVPAFASGGTLIDGANWWVRKGARGSRHPAFGGAVRSGHSKNSLHYQDRAVDLNYGPGGTNATEQAFFDKWVKEFKSQFPGLRVIWRAPGHFNHLHIDTSNGADIGEFSGAASSGGGGGFPFFDLNPLQGWIDKITNFKHSSGLFGDGLKNAAKSLVQGAIDKINPFNSGADSGSVSDPGGQGKGVERWTQVVIEALKFVGQSTSTAMVSTVLRRMKQESGGNPRAINNWDVNARRGTPSKGLMQVIDPTFRANAKAPYNKNIWDPMSNLVASMRYALKRYGSLPAAYNKKGGYKTGGLVTPAGPVSVFDNGGPWAPGTWGFNAGNDTEMVLTGQQADLVTTGIREMTQGGGGTLTVEQVNINIKGDVYGVDDLDAYLREAVEELMEDIEREWEERR